jgi:hypothetical protein
MIEIKAGEVVRLPIRLVSAATGLPLDGVIYSDVTIRIVYSDWTEFEYTPNIADWSAVDSGIAAGSGTYLYQFLPNPVPGIFMYIVKSTNSRHFVGSIKITSYDNDDTYVRMRQVQEGRWKIHTTGPDANRLVLYAADGTTAIQKWDLKDSAGAATAGVDVFERVPTEPIPS